MNRLNKTTKRNITDKFNKKLALAIAAIVAGAAPAGAFNIDFTYQPGMTDDQITAVEKTGAYWESWLGDDINVKLHVAQASALKEELGLNESGLGNVLALAIPGVTEKQNYKEFQKDLSKDITSDYDQKAFNNLTGDKKAYNMMVNSDGMVVKDSTLRMTYANAMALNNNSKYKNESLHGVIVINDEVFSDNISDDQSSDLAAVVAHEIGHDLGFISGVGSQVNSGSEFRGILDMYRYSDQSKQKNAIDYVIGSDTYLSIEGGNKIADLSNGSSEESQGVSSHWKEGVQGIMSDKHDLDGEMQELSDPDKIAFDVIGYDLKEEGASWSDVENLEVGEVTIKDRKQEIGTMITKSEVYTGWCQPGPWPKCWGQTAADGDAVATAVPENSPTTALLGMSLVGAISYLFKREHKDEE